MEYPKITQEEIDLEMQCFENWLNNAPPEEVNRAISSLEEWGIKNDKEQEVSQS